MVLRNERHQRQVFMLNGRRIRKGSIYAAVVLTVKLFWGSAPVWASPLYDGPLKSDDPTWAGDTGMERPLNSQTAVATGTVPKDGAGLIIGGAYAMALGTAGCVLIWNGVGSFEAMGFGVGVCALGITGATVGLPLFIAGVVREYRYRKWVRKQWNLNYSGWQNPLNRPEMRRKRLIGVGAVGTGIGLTAFVLGMTVDAPRFPDSVVGGLGFLTVSIFIIPLSIGLAELGQVRVWQKRYKALHSVSVVPMFGFDNKRPAATIGVQLSF